MLNSEDIFRIKKEKVKLAYLRKEKISDILSIPASNRTNEEENDLIEQLVDFPCF